MTVSQERFVTLKLISVSHHNQVLDLSMDMDTQFFEVSMDAQILKFGYRTKFCIFKCVKNIKDSN